MIFEALQRGKRLVKLVPPPTSFSDINAACRGLIGYAKRQGLHYPQLTTAKNRRLCRRRIDDATDTIEEVCVEHGPDPELLAELNDLRDAIAEHLVVADTQREAVGRTSAPPCLIRLDHRALIRRDRGYIGQAGPPPRANEIGLDARLLSRSGGRFRGEPRGFKLSQGSFFTGTRPALSPTTSAAGNPKNFGSAFVCPRCRR